MNKSLRTDTETVLTRARARTATLTECVDEADLVPQHSPLISPLVWDLAHIGDKEELWLVRDMAWDVLDQVRFDRELTAGGFAFGMMAQDEQQGPSVPTRRPRRRTCC
jgi:DinB superfamily